MNPHMHAELTKIAQTADLPCFRALDKLANSMMGYGGSNTAGAQMTPPPSMAQGVGSTSMGGAAPGATSMAGMSVHCDKCFAEIKEQEPKFCPKCGNRIKAVRDIKSAPKNGDPKEKEIGRNRGDEAVGQMGGPTGGEEALNEELSEGSYADMGKYSAAAKTSLLKKLVGASSIAAGVGLGVKGAQTFSDRGEGVRVTPGRRPQIHYKAAGVGFTRGSRFSALHFKPKGGTYNSVDAGITRIKRATRKNTQRILARA